MGILARPVDVAEAQRHAGQPVEAPVEAEIDLAAELARPVGGLGQARRLLAEREVPPLPFAVDRATGRGEYDRRAVTQRGLEDVDRAEHVDGGIEGRIGDRLADVGLSGEVKDAVGTEPVDRLVEIGGIGDIALGELGTTRQRPLEVSAPSGREVVDGEDVGAGVEQGVDEVRADEPGAPGHQCPHVSPPPRRRRRRSRG